MNLPGLINENEFYSDHYLAEIFSGDIREVLIRRVLDVAESGGEPGLAFMTWLYVPTRAYQFRKASARQRSLTSRAML